MIESLSFSKANIINSSRRFDTLIDLANWYDIFIVTAPLNEITQSSINALVLKALKDKVLVNVGRGKIIDEQAVFNSLKSSALKGFGCDVWYNYPTKIAPNCAPSQFSFETFDNVVMTPHNGGTEETAGTVKYTDVAEKIIQISKGNYARQVR